MAVATGTTAIRGLLGARSRQLLLLALAMAAAAYVKAVIGPLQEAIKSALALSDNQIALLQGPVMTLPMALAAIPIGIMVDRSSRKRALQILAMLNVAGCLATALASDFIVLAIVRCAVGLTATATAITTLSLLADTFPTSQRGRAITVVTIGEAAGTAAAFALGGTLLSLIVGPAVWQWALGWLAVPLAVTSLCVLLISEPERLGSGKKSSDQGRLRQLWNYRSVFAPLVAGKIMVGTAYGAVTTWAAPSFSRTFGYSPDRVGAALGLALLLSGAAGPLIGGPLADWCQRNGGPQRTASVVAILALICAPAGLFGVIGDFGWATILLTIFMSSVAVVGVMEMTLTTIAIPDDIRATCLSVLIAAGLVIGAGTSPLMVSFLSAILGGSSKVGTALTIVCAFTSTCAALVFLLTRRSFAVAPNSDFRPEESAGGRL